MITPLSKVQESRTEDKSDKTDPKIIKDLTQRSIEEEESKSQKVEKIVSKPQSKHNSILEAASAAKKSELLDKSQREKSPPQLFKVEQLKLDKSNEDE